MTKVLFICHGNICRSPMAEFVMKDLVDKAGLSDQFEIASAATSTEEIGNPVYPPARRKLAEHGISCEGKTARQMTRRDYETYDYLIAMPVFGLRIPSTVRTLQLLLPAATTSRVMLPVLSASMVCPPRYRLL